MEYLLVLLWNRCRGIFVEESLFLNNWFGVYVLFVAGYLLWNICYGIFVVESSLLDRCCGVIVASVVESLLWSLRR